MRPVIIGLGAVGSYLSVALSKAAIDHVGYDHDTVVRKNLQNQNYSYPDLYEYKAFAAQSHSPCLQSFNRKWTQADFEEGDILIACADDMATRRLIAKMGAPTFDTRLLDHGMTLYGAIDGRDLLDSMDYENTDVADQQDACHNPSSRLEVVLAAVGLMLDNIKHYIECGELRWKLVVWEDISHELMRM